MKIPARTLVLAGANVLLLVALGWRVLAPAPVPARSPRTPATIDLERAFDGRAARTDLATVSARPVFHKTRQFVQPPDPAAPSLLPPPPSYLFAGAMILPGRPAVAYLKHTQSGQPLKVRLGETVDGWTVSAIDARSVGLKFAEELINIGAPGSTTGGIRAASNATGGIVAVAPRAASSTPAGGVRVLTAPSASGGVSGVLLQPQAPQSKPRTYQPPPST